METEQPGIEEVPPAEPSEGEEGGGEGAEEGGGEETGTPEAPTGP